MMPNRSTDILFQLIKSLEKAEKRHFKLYIKRSSGKEDLKIVRLFDAVDKLKEYDEKVLLKKLPAVTKPQLANLKTHLYKQILASLRLLKSTDSLEKRIENLHITRSMQDRAEVLSAEANEVSRQIDTVARLSNLALKMYSWFVQHGHARNLEDEKDIRQFMKESLPEDVWEQTGFYQRLYLYQSYTYIAFIYEDLQK